jgi:hypothetical protein
VALLRKVKVPVEEETEVEADANGKKPEPKMRTVSEMDLIVEAVIKAAKKAEPWAVEHVAQRMDGKVRDQVEVTTNTNFKVRYESYEEARAALLEEGINIDRLPMLTDMRIPEGQDRS